MYKEIKLLETTERRIDYDCRHFVGDRPCYWHKTEKAVCTCAHYDPISERVLLIKLDAMGDVLRTTALLPVIAATHPRAAISWITRPESVPLLLENPYIAEVISYGTDALLCLQSRDFDRVINLDPSQTSAALATLARSPRKDGFVSDSAGRVIATNPAAQAWLEMGLFDDLKRANRRTYQSLMADILGMPLVNDRYVLELTALERTRGRAHLERLGLDFSRPIVGLNTGAGGRWQLKQWHAGSFVELIERLYRQLGAQCVLLGGPDERERNARIGDASAAPVFDAGADNPLRHFASLISHCNAVVTGDTLAMHMALALRTRVVALFGPTSSVEIETYGIGEKVVPEMACLCCYKGTCDFVPNCMDLISVEKVAAAVVRQLGSVPLREREMQCLP